jgi:hypothetical protein
MHFHLRSIRIIPSARTSMRLKALSGMTAIGAGFITFQTSVVAGS